MKIADNLTVNGYVSIPIPSNDGLLIYGNSIGNEYRTNGLAVIHVGDDLEAYESGGQALAIRFGSQSAGSMASNIGASGSQVQDAISFKTTASSTITTVYNAFNLNYIHSAGILTSDYSGNVFANTVMYSALNALSVNYSGWSDRRLLRYMNGTVVSSNILDGTTYSNNPVINMYGDSVIIDPCPDGSGRGYFKLSANNAVVTGEGSDSTLSFGLGHQSYFSNITFLTAIVKMCDPNDSSSGYYFQHGYDTAKSGDTMVSSVGNGGTVHVGDGTNISTIVSLEASKTTISNALQLKYISVAGVLTSDSSGNITSSSTLPTQYMNYIPLSGLNSSYSATDQTPNGLVSYNANVFAGCSTNQFSIQYSGAGAFNTPASSVYDHAQPGIFLRASTDGSDFNGFGFTSNVNSSSMNVFVGNGATWIEVVKITNQGNMSVIGSLSASSLVMAGGTSSQFLKADGSVDPTAYWWASNHPITLSGYGIASTDTLFDTKYLGISANAASASKLATARTIAMSGDGTWSTSFNGSVNATGALTLATLLTAGSAGSATAVPTLTWDAKGRITAVGSAAISIPHTQINDWATATSGFQASLGFTPVQQGGGTSMGGNKVYIGWGTDDTLRLQVDATNFGSTWPINITGSCSNANNANTLGGNSPAYYATASSLSNYLPLAGGTLTGALHISSTGYLDLLGGIWLIDGSGNAQLNSLTLLGDLHASSYNASFSTIGVAGLATLGSISTGTIHCGGLYGAQLEGSALCLDYSGDTHYNALIYAGKKSGSSTCVAYIQGSGGYGYYEALGFFTPTGTNLGFLKADGSTDYTTYLTANQAITLTGAVTGSGTTSIATSFANTYLAGIDQDLTTASSPTFAYITGVGDIFASKYMGYGTAGYGYKIGTNTGTLYSSDIGQPWAFWVRPYKYTGTNCQMRLGVSTRTTSGSSDIDAISIDGDGATSFIQMIYANGGISGDLTGHASLDLPLTGGTMTAGAKILTLQDMTISTGANSNYVNAPFVAQRNTSDGTTTHASIGFHNCGVNAAALFYHAGNSNFWFNDHIGGLYQLWSSKDFASQSITNWNTAYNWGNHASAGYLTANQSISLTGAVTGSGATSIATSFANTYLAGIDQDLTSSSSPTFAAMYTNSAFGTCGIVTGNADGAGYTTYNLKIKSWWGIGFESHDGVTRILMDTRTGGISTLGGINASGLITATGGISGDLTGTASNASALGGTAASSYLLSSTASSTYLPLSSKQVFAAEYANGSATSTWVKLGRYVGNSISRFSLVITGKAGWNDKNSPGQIHLFGGTNYPSADAPYLAAGGFYYEMTGSSIVAHNIVFVNAGLGNTNTFDVYMQTDVGNWLGYMVEATVCNGCTWTTNIAWNQSEPATDSSTTWIPRRVLLASDNYPSFSNFTAGLSTTTLTASISLISKYGTIDGQYHSTDDSYAGFGHKSCTTAGNYCLIQNASGVTTLNGSTDLHLRINNAGVMDFTSTLASITKPLTVAGLITANGGIVGNRNVDIGSSSAPFGCGYFSTSGIDIGNGSLKFFTPSQSTALLGVGAHLMTLSMYDGSITFPSNVAVNGCFSTGIANLMDGSSNITLNSSYQGMVVMANGPITLPTSGINAGFWIFLIFVVGSQGVSFGPASGTGWWLRGDHYTTRQSIAFGGYCGWNGSVWVCG